MLDVLEAQNSKAPRNPSQLALVVLWRRGEPLRTGEALFPRRQPAWFGRCSEGNGTRVLHLNRQQPGQNTASLPTSNPFFSRRPLQGSRSSKAVEVKCLGKCPLIHRGVETRAAHVEAGDILKIRGLCGFLCVERPQRYEGASETRTFREADSQGFVGDSLAAFRMRQRIHFVAQHSTHVLILGETGTGKELVAQAIHARLSRRSALLVSRSAAALPESLLDAELFGNARNYPNVGSPARPGLIGQAHESSLFFEEIGEISADLQAHFLRVFDSGEYQRLGAAQTRTADFRFIAATNRDVESLKNDLAARLALTIKLVGLNDRREDVPLLARHIVKQLAKQNSHLEEQFMVRETPNQQWPRLSRRW